MNNLFQFAKKKLLPSILITFLVILTVGTGVMGVGKVVDNLTPEKEQQPEVPREEVKGVSTNDKLPDNAIKNETSNKGATSGTSKTNVNNSNSGNIKSIALTGTSPMPTTAASSSGSCIIILFGKQYNITSLLTTHSGGNVFVCGTDMSASYQSRHGTNVSRMQPYLISSSATPTPVPTSGGGSTPAPTRAPTPVPATPTPSPTSGRCIITLFGKQYDITPLLTTHSGGNVFVCGTDMSASYQSRHGTNVSRMQKYLVNTSGGSTPTPTPLPSGAPPVAIPTPIEEDDDD